MQTRIGIVGCGGVAARHVEAWQKNGAMVTGLSDVQTDAAVKLADGCPGAKVYRDYLELLVSGEVDAISICTPPSNHEEIAVAALERGIHVLCEKPLAHTLEAAGRIVAAQHKSSALLMTAFRHRFLPGIRKAKEWIDTGRIGDLVCFNNTFCGPAWFMKDRWFSKKAIAGGGCMMDTSSHSVDLFRFLCGEIVEQHAVTHTVLEGVDVEDSSILVVKSAAGVLGTMTASWVAGAGVAELRIIGQQGMIVYDYLQVNEVRIKVAGATEWEVLPVAYDGGFMEEIAHFLAVIREGNVLECSVEEGLRALEVIQHVYTAK